MGGSSSPTPLPHIVIFPFMAKGHTIPLLHLAHLIHHRRLATLTFITTPLNAPFLRNSLTDTEAAVVELPFPQNIPNIPPNVESTDRLPSISLFFAFIDAVRHLQPQLEHVLESLPNPSFLISDGFLTWTADSASKFGIPRMVFYGMGNFSWTIQNILNRDRPDFAGLESPDGSIVVPNFPRIRLTKFDLSPPFDGPNPQGPFYDFMQELTETTSRSQGVIVNSFYELDGEYLDFWNKSIGPNAWCVGPLCQAHQARNKSELIEWLDGKRDVIYVAFGTQADVSEVQLREIAVGLEKSGLDFLWVVRTQGVNLGEGFEERVAERGKVVRDWVDQFGILRHESVRGFVSHCGWNSVLEGVSAGVPMLAWPMMAEQHLNAKFVVDELKIGVRVRASDGTRDGVVRGEDLAPLVRELVTGEKGKEAAENVKALAEAARKAVGDGGSSWSTLEAMIDDVCKEMEQH